MVGAFASGRILNPRTAHSQYMGGMIWGIGSALHEKTEIDPRASRYVNSNLADYMIPVNADIGEVRIPRLMRFHRRIEDSQGTHYDGLDEGGQSVHFFECGPFELHHDYLRLSTS